MTRLHNNRDALRVEHFGERKRDLFREAFLDLQAAREHVDDSSDLGEANDLAAWDVSDVYLDGRC